MGVPSRLLDTVPKIGTVIFVKFRSEAAGLYERQPHLLMAVIDFRWKYRELLGGNQFLQCSLSMHIVKSNMLGKGLIA